MSKIITLAHGSGGKLTQELIRDLILPSFKNPLLAPLLDSAIFEIENKKFAFTTDSYVVKPPFFPGGDIGKLCVSGTVNDLAVVGAKPVFISCGLIIEEGFSLEDLKKIVFSIQNTAKQVGASVVTGDTKVVEKGSADGIFINTTGIGVIFPEFDLAPRRIDIGDKIIINGTVGDHSVAVLSQRKELGFEITVASDCAPLYELVESLRPWARYIKFMRDPTRGGLAQVLNEIVAGREFGIKLWEKEIPLREETEALCELLGIDHLYLASEGRIVFFIQPEAAEEVLGFLQGHFLGKDARIIGEVVPDPAGKVYLQTCVGTRRVVDMLVEDQLPRIC